MYFYVQLYNLGLYIVVIQFEAARFIVLFIYHVATNHIQGHDN